jgi:hypothetical protein
MCKSTFGSNQVIGTSESEDLDIVNPVIHQEDLKEYIKDMLNQLRALTTDTNYLHTQRSLDVTLYVLAQEAGLTELQFST